MSIERSRKAVSACFHGPGVLTPTSTDGTLTVPIAPGGSKKPNQVKRAWNAKTRSVKRVRLAAGSESDED